MIVTNLRPWWHLTAEDWIQWTSHPGFVHFNFLNLILMMAAWSTNEKIDRGPTIDILFVAPVGCTNRSGTRMCMTFMCYHHTSVRTHVEQLFIYLCM